MSTFFIEESDADHAVESAWGQRPGDPIAQPIVDPALCHKALRMPDGFGAGRSAVEAWLKALNWRAFTRSPDYCLDIPTAILHETQIDHEDHSAGAFGDPFRKGFDDLL